VMCFLLRISFVIPRYSRWIEIDHGHAASDVLFVSSSGDTQD
jgi:hypothetical protein